MIDDRRHIIRLPLMTSRHYTSPANHSTGISALDRSTRNSTPFRTFSWALLVLLSTALPGCVRRRMTIRTTPPGATIYVDDQLIGTSPVSTDFTYYGVRTIKLMKDRFRTETLQHRFSPPWYQIPPIDFISENIWPGKLRDEHVLDYQLVPQPNVTNDQLRERAEALRSSARSGHVSPMVPTGSSTSVADPSPVNAIPQATVSLPQTRPRFR